VPVTCSGALAHSERASATRSRTPQWPRSVRPPRTGLLNVGSPGDRHACRPVSGLARISAQPSQCVYTSGVLCTATLAYRCGGSCGLAGKRTCRTTAFPFHPPAVTAKGHLHGASVAQKTADGICNKYAETRLNSQFTAYSSMTVSVNSDAIFCTIQTGPQSHDGARQPPRHRPRWLLQGQAPPEIHR
jgi:hypothetical protein